MTFAKQSFLHAFCLCAVFVASMLVLGDTSLNHDSSWYLISTLWFIEGVPIYQDILELNPPLAFYLTVPPVYFAKLTSIDPTIAMKGYVYILSGVSIYLGHRVLKTDGEFLDVDLGILNSIVAVCILIIPLSVFGQREHLMTIFAWPYLALAISEPAQGNARNGIAIGLFSSLGFALKPYFLAIPLLISLFLFLQNRKFRAFLSVQNLSILGFCITYLILSFLLHPSYFTDVVPKTVLVYDAYKSELLEVIGRAQLGMVVFAIIFIVYFSIPNSRWKRVAIVAAAAALGSLISYLVQSKGWYYQQVPFRVFTWVFGCSVAFGLFAEAKRRAVGVALCVIVIAQFPILALFGGAYKSPISITFAKHFNCATQDQQYQVFASNVYPSFPLGNITGATPAVKSPALWLFPGVVHRLTLDISVSEREMLEAVLDDYTQGIIQDLVRAKPQVIIVDDQDQKAYFNGAVFNYIDHFERYHEFITFWQEYRFVEKAFGFNVYKLEAC